MKDVTREGLALSGDQAPGTEEVAMKIFVAGSDWGVAGGSSRPSIG
jgi:hypothetical protein